MAFLVAGLWLGLLKPWGPETQGEEQVRAGGGSDDKLGGEVAGALDQESGG